MRAEKPKSLRANSPVYYRGIEVGTVQKLELAPNAASAGGSAFWDTSGINVKGGS